MWIFVLKGLTTETALSVLVVCGLLVCAWRPSHDSVVCSVSFVQCLIPQGFFQPVSSILLFSPHGCFLFFSRKGVCFFFLIKSYEVFKWCHSIGVGFCPNFY